MVFQRLSRLLLVLSLYVLAPAGWCHEEATDAEADRLLHEEALFHFLRSDYRQTLVLLENFHIGSNHIDNEYHNRNHILAMEAGLRLGLYGTVEGIVEHLAFTARERDVKHKALFYKGKLAYVKGQWAEAIRHLAEARKLLPPDLRNEAAYLQAMSLLNRKQVVEAAQVLGTISKDSLWGGYGYFNLGLVYAGESRSVSRALVALRVAVSFTDRSDEGRELSDRINLAAGNLAMESGEYAKAEGFLSEVMAEGVSAPAAIVLYGQAQAAQGRSRTAIQTWYRAKKFSLMMPGVADAFQAIAYGYEQEKLRGTAIDAYTEAVSVYEKELRQLAELRQELQKEGVLALLNRVQVDESGVEWFLSTDLATNTPRIAFVFHIMGQDDFFDEARLLLELQQDQENLQQGIQRLAALESVLKKRLGKAGKSRKTVQMPVTEPDLNRLIDARNALVEQYKRQPDSPARQAAALQIRALDGELRVLKRRYQNLKVSVTDMAGFFRSQLQEASALKARFQDLETQLGQVVAALDKQLTESALALLEQHRRYMHDYSIRGQMALVNLYDDIAVSELQQSLNVQELNQPVGGAL